MKTATVHRTILRTARTTTEGYAAHAATCEACAANPPVKVALDIAAGDRIDRIGWTPVEARTVTRVEVVHHDDPDGPTVRFWFTADAHPEMGELWSSGAWWTPIEMLQEVTA